ncbi:cytochrome c oxidase subunit II [Leptolyngbya cf. ectocarpi LEGE 11479]|uniref:Cytochrome c oxidase subunit 2 n=1 Tax=Leptolyngbya cf. ectocarpi LEGE 11479 TaxID=1828722 RepID=A0A928ZXX3_LEPEC|nr:cytochrome c oxidase subunit II [Leptolyngbya ectocarpi]MBE9069450.1 cytochrome c oxidase subunit II [Leptolyngbya cf. ectocarpi LEGE 11479]
MKLRTGLILAIVASILALISIWMGQQAYGWMPTQASAESVLVDDLFSFLVTLGTFIFLGVFVALAYAVLFQRAGKYDASDGPAIEGNVTLEVVWTAIPFVLVMWIAFYSFQIYDQMSILGPMEHVHPGMASAKAANANAVSQPIEVLARQWAWEFRYPAQNVSSTELHLPNNQRATLLLKSEDVIHGFFIPAFRIKQDIVPNEEITFEFTPIQEGKYRLRDSQYSGTYFAAMQADVVVESPEAHQEWLTTAAAQPPAVAYNEAFEDYRRASEKGFSAGWKTVPPAAPPLVNYSGSPRKEE